MKRITLVLTVTPDSVLLLEVIPQIHGNIDPVIEILGQTMHRDNILIDVRSLRCHHGIYELRSRHGLFDHNSVLDVLSQQSGLLMLRPGEVVTFSFIKQYIHFFNQPNLEGKPYLQFIVSKEKIRNHLGRALTDLRNGIIKKISQPCTTQVKVQSHPIKTKPL